MLISCAELTPSIRGVREYAKIIARSSEARRLQNLVQTTAFSAITSKNVGESADELMNGIFEIVSKQKRAKLKNVGDIGLSVLDSYLKNDFVSENRANTGFKKVDEILKGMSAGNLVILAARPKVGKTSFALEIAENVARTGKTVAFYSLEMESSEIYERLLARSAKIPMNTLINRNFEKDLTKIADTVDGVYKLSLLINDSSSISVQDIRLECRMIKDLGLIVIDYLQLMKSIGKSENRNQEVGRISRELKVLAGDLGVPILCLSQLNRTSDESQRPMPSELRDSGELEQNANKLILMWCLEKRLDENFVVKSKTIGVDVALNRRGSTGVTKFNFNGNYMTFKELEEPYDEENGPKNWREKYYGG